MRSIRHIRAAAVFSAVAIVLSMVTLGGSASAQSVESLRDRAAAAAARLNTLQAQSDALNEKYLQTQEDIDQLKERQDANSTAVDKAKAELEKARGEAADYLVEAYVGASVNDRVVVSSNNVNEAVNQKVMLSLLKSDRTQLADKLDVGRQDLEDLQAELKASRDALDKRRADQADIVKKIEASVGDQQAILNGANSELNEAIRAEQARIQAAAAEKARVEAQRAEARRVAAANASAAAAASARASEATNAAPRRRRNNPSSGGSSGYSAPPAFVPPPIPASSVNSGAAGAIAAARSRMGTPYRWGGSTPAGFDCSGLMMWAWAQVGVSLPRTSGAQRSATQRISRSQLQPGDLVFSGNPVHHVGMYVGGGQMIHSPHTGDVVKISSLYGGSLTFGRIR
ncbi:MAG: NlpC/P60 family protein [Microthrixaceae bacterium]